MRLRPALIIAVMAMSLPAPAQQVSGRLGNFMSMTAEAAPDFDCSRESGVDVAGETAEAFGPVRDVALRRLLGGVRGALQAQCGPVAVPNLIVRGLVNGQEVYRARYEAANGTLIRLPPEGTEAEAPGQNDQKVAALVRDLQTIARCDELAAHPDDPEATAPGVADNQIQPAAAMEACIQAVRIDPDSPRLAFQLGRALLLSQGNDAGEHEAQALETLLSAAEKGHGGSLAYLADFHLQGIAGIDPNPEAAMALYQQAADAGFAPAAQFLSEAEEIEPEGWFAQKWKAIAAYFGSFFEDYTQEDELRDGIVLDGYHMPKAIEAAVYQNEAHADMSYKVVTRYLFHAANSVNNVCENKISAEKILGYQQEVLSADNLMASTITEFLSDLMNAAEFVRDPTTGLEVTAARAAMIQGLEEAEIQASQDVLVLIERYGCDGVVTGKFAEGVEAILFSREVPQSFFSDAYMNRCRATEPRSLALTYREQRSEYCTCVLTRLNNWPASLKEYRALLADFQHAIDSLPTDSGVKACTSGHWR